MIIQSFERNNIRFKQFSAATMDPWVDFIGVPKEQKDENGPFLELVRPKDFRDDEVEAIFFDELNRSHKKVRNAVMELIQFKSINGKKFPNLKMIWGAVNPEEDEDLKYDVEKLDPAQSDRFQVQIEIPYKPYKQYFVEKYGRDTATAACDWWDQLTDNMKKDISPRRLEYAIQMFRLGGNMVHVIPPYSNVSKLEHALKNGSPIRDFKNLLKSGKEDDLKKWISDENNYASVREEIIKNPQPVLHLLEEEKMISLASISKTIADYLFSNHTKFEQAIKTIAENSPNKTLKKQAITVLQTIPGNNNPGKLLEINKPDIPATIEKLQKEVSSSYQWNKNCNINFKKAIKKTKSSELTISACVAACLKASEQTTERMKICNSVIRIISNKTITSLSKDEAESSLNIIDWIASKTQTPVLYSKTEELDTCINVCTMALRGHGVVSEVKEFANKYPFISGKIMHSQTPQFSSTKVIIPKV